MFAFRIPTQQATTDLMAELASAQSRLARQDRDIVELNHRIANSLQLAADMLIFEQHRSRDPIAKAALEASRARLIAIGQLHRHLHSQVEGTSVSLASFLGDLNTAIIQTTGLDCRTEAQDVLIAGETAQQIGIIINECAINAAVHAYGGRPGGRLDISGRREAEQLIVTVADQGGGLNAASEPGHTGLGMTIIAAIVRELKGALTLKDDHGVQLTLRIPHLATVAGRLAS